MNKTLTAAGLGVVFLAAFPGAALAQGLALYEVAGDWEISLARDGEGNFEVCLATLTYENGEAVIFYSDGTRLTLGLLLGRWQLDTRDQYEIAVQFNGHPRLPATGFAGDDKKGILADRDFSPNIAEVREEGNMYLHTAAGSLRFDISGAAAALDTVFRCATENQPSSAQ